VPVGRLAPSPTGKLHLGHARTFLLAWWHARSRGGKIVMRMEDLDIPRAVPGVADAILRDLEWLGLDWDGPVVTQSSRLEPMRAAARTLAESGQAYPCVCTRGDVLSALGAPQTGAEEPRYPDTCRGRYASVEEAERISGKPAALRFVVPKGMKTFVDHVVGRFATDVEKNVGDFVIARKGGIPAYQLAVVMDDAAEGVTEIVRGDDLLPSTARQRLLQDALGLPHAATWHVPLVTDATGRRLAKRADDLSLAELGARGADPRAIVAWAARTAGVPGVEFALAREITPLFTMTRLPKAQVSITTTTVEELLLHASRRRV
jgi:glutamyl-tRNA synthetase